MKAVDSGFETFLIGSRGRALREDRNKVIVIVVVASLVFGFGFALGVYGL